MIIKDIITVELSFWYYFFPLLAGLGLVTFFRKVTKEKMKLLDPVNPVKSYCKIQYNQ